MSAEKERRYQELYKNRFVNPIDQGIGRRTGWVLNKEVRKDSEGFELFDDYWSDSGDESVSDLSLHPNKENKGRPYKLSSPITHMPDFTLSSHNGSTDVEPLSDVVGLKSLKSNSVVSEATSNNVSAVVESDKTKPGKTQDDTHPAEQGNDAPDEDVLATVAVATPTREEGGIQEADITGSIIRGSHSFEAPTSVLQGFKTKTRLSFGSDVTDSPTGSSTRIHSSRDAEEQDLNEECSTSNTTLRASSQSEEKHDEPSGGQDEDTEITPTAAGLRASSQEKTVTSAVMQEAKADRKEKDSSQTTETTLTVPEKTAEKDESEDMANEQSTNDITENKEITMDNAEYTSQMSSRKSTGRKAGVSKKKSTAADGLLQAAKNKPTRRRRRNETHLEDIQMSGDEGMFISLQKSFVPQQDASNLTEQQFLDVNDEEIVEIVKDDSSLYKTTLANKSKSRKTRKSTVRKSKKDKSSPKAKSKKGRGRKSEKPEVTVTEIIDILSDSEVGPSPAKKMADAEKGKTLSSEDSELETKKAALQQPQTSSRVARNKSRRQARSSSSDAQEDSGTTESDMDLRKGTRSRTRSTKKAEQNKTTTITSDHTSRSKRKRKLPLSSVAPGSSKQSTDGSVDTEVGTDESENDAKSSRKRSRSKRKTEETQSLSSPNLNEAETGGNIAVGDSVKEADPGRSPTADVLQSTQNLSTSKPVRVSQSARKKRLSVRFSSIEVMPDDPSRISGNENEPEDAEITSQSSQQALDDTEPESSPRKKFKVTPGAKVSTRRPASSRKYRGGKKKQSETAQERTTETTEEAVIETKNQRRSSSIVRGGKKRAGKRKLYSGDIPSSFLDDPSLTNGPPSVPNITSKDLSTTSNLEASQVQQPQPTRRSTVASRDGSRRGRGRGRGRGSARGRGNVRTAVPDQQAPQNSEESEDVVIDFLTNYESSKESGSAGESDDPPLPVGSGETSSLEVNDISSSAASSPGGMYQTVYPEPTPRSILKGTTSRKNSRQKNLTLQFFEVPRPKAIIVAPDSPEDGQRRTKRNRVRPVEFWRNERAEYQRRKSGGFVLVGVQSPEATSPETQTQKRGGKTRGKRKIPQTPAELSMHASPPPGGKIAEHSAMVVMNPDTQEEVEVDTLRTSKMNAFVGPSGKPATADDPITLCKSITQKAFSSGILTIRPLSEKGMQFVQKDTMVFYITRGKVSVTIHHTTSILQNGDMFFVPQGNMYNIKNLRRDEAKLIFFQHKGR